MRSVAAALLAFALLLSYRASAQTATVVETNKRSTGYTFSNASGFSLANNGTLTYSDQLNQLVGSPCCMAATLTVNGDSITITPTVFEADTGLKAQKNGGQTLSSRLPSATMQPKQNVNQLRLQHDVVVGGVTRLAASASYTLQDKVDGQSLSLFSQFQPSVFP